MISQREIGRLTLTAFSQLSAWVRMSGEISTPSFHLPRRNTIRIDLAVYDEARASLMVWKFFRDLDILEPEMDKWPMCKK